MIFCFLRCESIVSELVAVCKICHPLPLGSPFFEAYIVTTSHDIIIQFISGPIMSYIFRYYGWFRSLPVDTMVIGILDTKHQVKDGKSLKCDETAKIYKKS